MRKTDVVFFFCVLLCAGLFAARSISQAVPLLSGGSPSASSALGAAGQPRQVDMLKFERLLEERALSDHEAEFYEPVGVPSPSGEQGPNGPAAPPEGKSQHPGRDK